MQLENLVIDSLDPQRLGRYWEAALSTETLTDAPGIYETRLVFGDGAFLDLCFPQVPKPPSPSPRLHLDLTSGLNQSDTVERLVALGATRLDIGQGAVPWVVLGDLESNPFCVLEERPAYDPACPVAAFPLSSADPERDGDFWAWLTGWSEVTGYAPRSLQHPSGFGPLLELCPEGSPKSEEKNRLHLDVRLEQGEEADEVEAQILGHGGSRFDPGWGDLPWRSYRDPSGNEFCVLPVSTH